MIITARASATVTFFPVHGLLCPYSKLYSQANQSIVIAPMQVNKFQTEKHAGLWSNGGSQTACAYHPATDHSPSFLRAF